jgi:hypothetical protein
MAEPVDIDLQAVTPEEAERLRRLGVRLPSVSETSVDPSKAADYVENRLTAVGFSIYLGGYHLYCTNMNLPIMLPDDDIDFTLQSATPVSYGVYPDRRSADAAVRGANFRPPMLTPFAYYSAAGGAIIAPTIFSPATTPKTILTMASARRTLAETVQRELTTLAISIVGGMILRTVLARLVRIGSQEDNVPRATPRAVRIRPVNGTVNVGGGLEPEARSGCTNLNPINPNSGGPSAGIPNHVRAGFEDIGDIFEPGSVTRIFSRRLRFVDVRWQQAATGSATVMAPGGTLDLNVWTQSPQEVSTLIRSFQQAGFRNVAGNGYVGPGTVITGTWRP